jgi:hypothetical protein
MADEIGALSFYPQKSAVICIMAWQLAWQGCIRAGGLGKHCGVQFHSRRFLTAGVTEIKLRSVYE